MKNKNKNVSRRQAIKGISAVALGTTASGTTALAASSRNKKKEKNYENKTNKELDGKTALITGGARGIGLASAEELAKAGANIVLFDVASDLEGVNYPLATNKDLANAKRKIESYGVKCISYKGDVRDRSALSDAVDKTVEKFGTLDHVVANAGVTQVGMMEYFSEKEIQTVIDINVTGVVKTIQASIPVMRKQNSGGITILSSVLGRMGEEWFPVYSGTKWAVIGLAKSTALIMGKHNVTCNAICPTVVKTKLMDNKYVLGAMSPENPTWEGLETVMKQWRNPLPIGAYNPNEIGEMVKFFASKSGQKISGEVLGIAAGSFARNTA
jgi:NAD(P)-dependent dehydrogenase (short-subunit alcohol dehydrogenase family)